AWIREKPYACEVCGHAFSRKWNYTCHIKGCRKRELQRHEAHVHDVGFDSSAAQRAWKENFLASQRGYAEVNGEAENISDFSDKNNVVNETSVSENLTQEKVLTGEPASKRPYNKAKKGLKLRTVIQSSDIPHTEDTSYSEIVSPIPSPPAQDVTKDLVYIPQINAKETILKTAETLQNCVISNAFTFTRPGISLPAQSPVKCDSFTVSQPVTLLKPTEESKTIDGDISIETKPVTSTVSQIIVVSSGKQLFTYEIPIASKDCTEINSEENVTATNKVEPDDNIPNLSKVTEDNDLERFEEIAANEKLFDSCSSVGSIFDKGDLVDDHYTVEGIGAICESLESVDDSIEAISERLNAVDDNFEALNDENYRHINDVDNLTAAKEKLVSVVGGFDEIDGDIPSAVNDTEKTQHSDSEFADSVVKINHVFVNEKFLNEESSINDPVNVPSCMTLRNRGNKSFKKLNKIRKDILNGSFVRDAEVNEEKKTPVRTARCENKEIILIKELVEERRRKKERKLENTYADCQSVESDFDRFVVGSDISVKYRQPRKIVQQKSVPDTGFECKVCGKILTTPYGLTNHLMVHEGQKPFICKVCNHAFTKQWNLKTHLQNRHKIEPTKADLEPTFPIRSKKKRLL
ncbi:CRZ1-like protein, partial [Mya arenaria]